jgi:deoxyhypusine synthase
VSECKSRRLGSERILPDPIDPDPRVADLIDRTFLAYNAGRLQAAARLMAEQMCAADCWVGMSLSGALTPAGLGRSVLVPLIRSGFVDWITTTGAILYHDAHYGLDLELYRGSAEADDRALLDQGVVRIYDVLLDYEVLLQTDRFLRNVMAAPEFGSEMSSAQLHHLLGKYLAAREDELGVEDTCVLSTAYRCGVPCYVPSPGDSGIGLNIADLWMKGRGPRVDVSLDVNETTALVYEAKKTGQKTGVVVFGGGSPKNFMLQTQPQIQEVLGLKGVGHDFFVQVTDARPDTGGLSGATASEAVSWGKIDPDRLPGAITVYADMTIAAPLLAAYVLSRGRRREFRRLYDRREQMLERLREDFLARHPD